MIEKNALMSSISDMILYLLEWSQVRAEQDGGYLKC